MEGEREGRRERGNVGGGDVADVGSLEEIDTIALKHTWRVKGT